MERIITTPIHNKELTDRIRSKFAIPFQKYSLRIVMPSTLSDDDWIHVPMDADQRKWLAQCLGFKNTSIDIGLVYDHSRGYFKSDPDHPENKAFEKIKREGLAHLATLPSKWNPEQQCITTESNQQ